jgi:predicted deacylase
MPITGFVLARRKETVSYFGLPDIADHPLAPYMVKGSAHAPAPETDGIKFQDFNQSFVQEAKRLGLKMDYLSNGAVVARLERNISTPTIFNKQPKTIRLALVGGIHGNERSGPFIILDWLRQQKRETLHENPTSLWICPLLNNDGWDADCREWKGQDLNRIFKQFNAPVFIQEFKQQLLDFPPTAYLDFHEDCDTEQPYFFHNSQDISNYSFEMQTALNAGYHLWRGKEDDGNAEMFVRDAGCNNSMTVEVPSRWPIRKRIIWGRQTIQWFYSQIAAKQKPW